MELSQALEVLERATVRLMHVHHLSPGDLVLSTRRPGFVTDPSLPLVRRVDTCRPDMLERATVRYADGGTAEVSGVLVIIDRDSLEVPAVDLVHDRFSAEIAEARELGRNAGAAAGSWAADGNTSPEAARAALEALDGDGDPELLPARPDLSGDGPTPASLLADLGLVDPDGNDLLPDADTADALQAEICEAWEEGALEGFEEEARRVLEAAAAPILRVEALERALAEDEPHTALVLLRELAGEWHSGQGSALYAFCSSGTVLEGAGREVVLAMRSTSDALQRRELTALRDWLEPREPAEEDAGPVRVHEVSDDELTRASETYAEHVAARAVSCDSCGKWTGMDTGLCGECAEDYNTGPEGLARLNRRRARHGLGPVER